MSASKPAGLTLVGLALAGAVVACVVVEIGLRLGGFRYDQTPTIHVGWPEPKAISDAYQPDPELLWVTKTYHEVLAAAQQKSPAVVFMGDSCTEFGTYPRKTMDLMKSRDPSLANGVKLGVGGWTSEQGLAQLRRDVLPLHPRVITIYYGWNDHWITWGPPDQELVGMGAVMPAAVSHFRIFQLLAALRLRSRRSDGARPNRVDPARYRRNLQTMVQLASGAGIATVLITAPSGHVKGHEPEVLRERHLRNLHDLIPLHEQYVEATRMAARETGAVLCDVAAHFENLPREKRLYFHRDGIHLATVGDAVVASVLVGCIQQAAR